jgi:hypothetical protein
MTMPSNVDASASPNREQHLSVVQAEGVPADTRACPACYEEIMRIGNAVEAIAQAMQRQTTPLSAQRGDDLPTGTEPAEGQSTPSFFAYRWIS